MYVFSSLFAVDFIRRMKMNILGLLPSRFDGFGCGEYTLLTIGTPALNHCVTEFIVH